MIVTCDNCHARYRVAPDRISSQGSRIECRRCRHVFVVHPQEETDTISTADVPVLPTEVEETGDPPSHEVDLATLSRSDVITVEVPLPVRNVDRLDFRRVGIQAWKVKVKIGLVYDFSDYRTLAKYIQDGRVEPSDLLSHNGADWTVINKIPDLKQHFVDTYIDAEKGVDGTGDQAEDGGAPSASNGSAASPKGAPVGVDSGVSGLDIEIEADDPSGPTLSDLVTSAMEEVDDEPTMPIGQTATGGRGKAASPRFVDPFEALRARQKTRGSPLKGAGPSAYPGAPNRAGESRSNQSGLIVVVGLAVLGLVAWAAMPGSEIENADTQKAAQVVRQKKSEIAAKQKAKAKRKRLSEELAAVAEAVNEDQDPFTPELSPEEQLVPVVPEEFRDGGMGAGVAADVTSQINASDMASMGADAMARADWTVAARSYREALILDSSNRSWRENLGRALYMSGDITGSVMELERAADGGSSTAHKWLGHVARDQGDTAGAMMHYQVYLKSNPRDAAQIQREIARLEGG